jgi:hypothetical protein
MANIPEDGAVLAEDSALADEADPDKRIPQQVSNLGVSFFSSENFSDKFLFWTQSYDFDLQRQRCNFYNASNT